MTPYTSFILILFAIAWSIVGATFWSAFRQEQPTQGWVTFLVCFGGQCVWTLAVWHGLLYLRRRVLAHFGVEGYHCGCSDCHGQRANRA